MKKLLFILSVVSLLSLFVGVGHLTPLDLYNGSEEAWRLFMTSRLPRLIAIILAGAGLSIAGLIMQQVSQNRFASPSTSGTVESAMMGYLLSLVFFGNGDQVWLIFLTSLAGTLLFVTFIQSVQFKNAIFVPLIGIVFGNVVQSCAIFLAYKYDVVQNLSTWTVANFASVLEGNYEMLYLAIPMVIFSYLYATHISAVGMGKDFATNLGLNYQQVVIIGVALVSMMTSTVVMIVGQLPFLGLIVPNLVSLFAGDNLKKNIPITALFGALLVLICDISGRVIIYPYEVPISLIINVLGGVVFVLFVIKGRLHER